MAKINTVSILPNSTPRCETNLAPPACESADLIDGSTWAGDVGSSTYINDTIILLFYEFVANLIDNNLPVQYCKALLLN